MRMPPGWDGIETIRQLWSADPHLQIVISTGATDYSWSPLIERLNHSGDLIVLHKRFDQVELWHVACTLAQKWRQARHVDGRAGRFVVVQVADNGSGLPPEVLPRIFEPFFTTKDVGKGTGLGLSTVYSVARQHEGWIDVQTAVGKGTTFTVFPCPASRRMCSSSRSIGSKC